MVDVVTVEAPSVAAFVDHLIGLRPSGRVHYVATENGEPWARVDVSVMGSTRAAVFPVDREGVRGDTARRSQSGVAWPLGDWFAGSRIAPVVVNRARVMF
jgi:hypothetical protein